MRHLLPGLLTVLALPGLAVAGLALLGAVVVRQPEPPWAALVALLLLALPVLGLSTLLPRRGAGVLLGALLWPPLLLAGFPLLLPGERAGSLQSGLALLDQALGEPLGTEGVRLLSERLDALLPAAPARRPPPELAPALDLAPLPATRPEVDQVVLPYEGRGHSLVLPVAVEGPDGRQVEISMLFDTGATYSTLDRSTLRAAGYELPENGPTITSHTANGDIETPLLLVDRLWVGGLAVEGVAVALCDVCADPDEYQGLLGLNVSSRFLVTLDTARRELILEPHEGPDFAAVRRAARLDVDPWLELSGEGSWWPDGRSEIEVTAHNRAEREVQAAWVRIECPGRQFRLPLGRVPPGGSVRRRASLPRGEPCSTFRLSLDEASW